MTLITNNNGTEVVLSSKYEIERFNNFGIKNMNFFNKHSPYDIFKDSESVYVASRLNSNFIFSKVIKINKIKGLSI